jgi:hypothetical protein
MSKRPPGKLSDMMHAKRNCISLSVKEKVEVLNGTDSVICNISVNDNSENYSITVKRISVWKQKYLQWNDTPYHRTDSQYGTEVFHITTNSTVTNLNKRSHGKDQKHM